MLENRSIEQLEALKDTLVWMLGTITLEIEERKAAQHLGVTYKEAYKEKRSNRPSLVRQLKQYQQDRKLSTRELAKELALSGSVISAWYRGKWKPGRTAKEKIKSILQIAKVE